MPIIIVVFAGFFLWLMFGTDDGGKDRKVASSETYRLVQALGNTERVSAKGLSKRECESRKRELKEVATALGTFDEQTGYGSITCLPDSLFMD
ncbi:hypothetical protein [Sinorhizobium sp. RAC02]|uniref:hypothetical protein n=1 Tax=Sinorhizobium sp. RAC02 TaxID=1842534 RepID=UPI00083E24EB|nr:hypothetical protein [Sinorhizobium sp. RAC02]AOF91847.1 hypothetical protein BSY16_12 [Sinorhizobium sp. RAC02]